MKVLPMCPVYSVTYVPGRTEAEGLGQVGGSARSAQKSTAEPLTRLYRGFIGVNVDANDAC